MIYANIVNSHLDLWQEIISNADAWLEIILGLVAGAGYSAKYFFPSCEGAGFEMVTSAFLTYAIYSNNEWELWQQIVLPLPELAQIGAQGYFIYVCIFDPEQVPLTEDIVNYLRLVQVVEQFFVWIAAFNGPIWDYFLGTFSAVKQLANFIESFVYFFLQQQY